MQKETLSCVKRSHSAVAHFTGRLLGLLAALLFLFASPAAVSANFTVDTSGSSITGLWWNQNESGWGAAITQEYGMIFVTMYTYDAGGKPVWYVASSCPVVADGCTGTLYSVTGGTASTVPWNGANIGVTSAGTLKLAFTDTNTGTLTYTINGVSGSRAITRQIFSNGSTQPAADYSGLWWNASESGWGVALTRQYDMTFATIYTYDASGKPIWYVASSCPMIASGCSGTLYSVTGGSPLTTAWSSANLGVASVGTLNLSFTDANTGSMTFTINGASSSKTIARQIFASPPVAGTATGTQMGGARQGTPLNLTGAVTTVTKSVTATGGLAGGVTSDGSNLYAIFGNRIIKVVIATGAASTFAGSSTDKAGSADGTGTAASFNQPADITTDGINLYLSDSSNFKIRKIEIATGVVTTLAGSGVYTTTPTDGTGTAATFYYTKGITTDGTYLYVQDITKLRKIEIATGVVTSLGYKLGGTGNGQGITIDGSNLYEIWGNRIFKRVLATGVAAALAGDTNGNSGSADGTGTAAAFSNPSGITTDGTSLYVSDYANNKIRKIEIATGVVTTLAGSGKAGSADGTGSAASFSYPEGITTDGRNLYVPEYGTGKIRKIQ